MVAALSPWEFKIVLDKGVPTPAYLQIAHAIISEIERGRLAPGTALPGTRELALQLGVNRKTVQQAYEELVSQTWLTAEATRGTFVSARLPVVQQNSGPSRLPFRQSRGKTGFVLSGHAPEIPFEAAAPGVLVFDDGAPDTRLLPAELLAREYRRVLLSLGRQNRLGYGDPRGIEALRVAIAEMLRLERGLDCGPDNICITRGSQMAILIAARILVGPNDLVAIEELSYPPAREAFRAAGAVIATIRIDENGLIPAEIEQICRHTPLRAIYLTPHHQFPTTVTLPPERRIQLLSLAEQYGFVIVEDDYDHEFNYTHRPILPLAGAHGGSRGIYIGSLSKLLSPSLRLGYLVADETIINRAASEVMLIDRQGDPATEGAAASLIESGALKSHTRKVLRIYDERRQTMAATLRATMGDLVDFTSPQGGLAMWVKFRGLNAAQLAARAADEGVTFLPGQAFVTGPNRIEAARLGYGRHDPETIVAAINVLAKAAKAQSKGQ